MGGVLVWKLVYIGLLDFNLIELFKKFAECNFI